MTKINIYLTLKQSPWQHKQNLLTDIQKGGRFYPRE